METSYHYSQYRWLSASDVCFVRQAAFIHTWAGNGCATNGAAGGEGLSLFTSLTFKAVMNFYCQARFFWGGGSKLQNQLMVLGVKSWAFAHLLSNGSVADILLFGSFLAWAILYYAIARRRDRAEGVTYKAVGVQRDLIAVIVGLAFYGAFAVVLHQWLIGVAPFS